MGFSGGGGGGGGGKTPIPYSSIVSNGPSYLEVMQANKKQQVVDFVNMFNSDRKKKENLNKEENIKPESDRNSTILASKEEKKNLLG